jgi:[ribosomal protein S5]-alanine N-acetyltransferase
MYGPRIQATFAREGKEIKLELGPVRNEEEAATLFSRWFSDNSVRAFMAGPWPISVSREHEIIAEFGKSRDLVFWTIYADGDLIGSTSVFDIDRVHQRAEFGILIGDKSAWGKGIATAVEAMVLDYAFSNVVARGLNKVFARVVEGNTASRRALENVGLRTIGIMRKDHWARGKWWDVWYGELLQEDWRSHRDQALQNAGITKIELYPGCEE